MSEDLVLVTGGSGFVAVHCIVQLLRAGYLVRTTVRSLTREAEARGMVAVGGVEAGERLGFTMADLERDAGWREAAAGCRFVLHVASPFPAGVPKHEDDLIVPAREGALRVLRAARDAGVERVVMTSSFAAVGYGHPPQERPFDETDWTDVGAKGVGAYQKSKTLAERAAWDFVAREGGGLELSVVNPVGVFGPVLGPDLAASIVLVKRFLDGDVPGCPRLHFAAVDVRDVASMHLMAMVHPAAKGERFLAVAGEVITPLEMMKMLKGRMGEAAKRAPLREIPDWVLRLVALWDSGAKLVAPELGVVKRVSGEKARRVLGWAPRSNEEAIVSCGESLVRLGLVKQGGWAARVVATLEGMSTGESKKALTFQEVLFALQRFWAERGCVLQQPYDLEVGAGTMSPDTFLRVLGPEPVRIAYAQPSRRPADGRYGENPNRLFRHTQFQVILKPPPERVQEVYLESLEAIGIDLLEHDIKFEEDNWEWPVGGAWGVGWQVMLDGQEITQFTYFQQCGGMDLDPISGEITYGIERLAQFVQDKDSIYDIVWSRDAVTGLERTYGEVRLAEEQQFSAYAFDYADVGSLWKHLELYEAECLGLLALGKGVLVEDGDGLAMERFPVLGGYELALKCSHCFNLLDARGAVSVTERVGVMGRIRDLAVGVARLYALQRRLVGKGGLVGA